MTTEENETEEQHPYDAAIARADALQLEGDERDDFIETRMKRAGFKRGPGEWLSVDSDSDDDGPKDDDDEPMTRGDYRRIRAEQKKKQGTSFNPPRKKATGNGENNGGEGKSKKNRDPWW